MVLTSDQVLKENWEVSGTNDAETADQVLKGAGNWLTKYSKVLATTTGADVIPREPESEFSLTQLFRERQENK